MKTLFGIIILACNMCACDIPSQSPRVGFVASIPFDPVDCRDAHYCYRDCLGAAFIEHEQLVDEHTACVESCEPQDNDAAHHFDWWVSALETQCENDWTDECLIRGTQFDYQTLSSITLDGCMRQGSKW